MRHLKESAALLCAAVLSCAALSGCGSDSLPLDAQHGIADQSNLYGMCYLMEERSADSLDVETEVRLMRNLGVKTVRQWMHFSHFMKSPTELKENCTTTTNMHELLAACEEAGILNIGMNHHNFCTTRTKASATAKPFARDVSDGSEYVQWLNDYYLSWYTLVSEFPEVEYWEIDNEVNNPGFMTDAAGQSSYSVKQMAEIATDMFYYASRAIHDANPEAKTIMGGLTEPNGLGRGNTANFLQMLYDNVASGEYGYFYGREDRAAASRDPDDYFMIACWHPYMQDFNRQHFIEINNEYYEIILKNERKHKKVFFTEIGWNDDSVGGESVSIRYLEEMYEAVASMPYVETVNVFKLYDNGTLNNWDGPYYQYWGLFHDADPAHVYVPCSKTTDGINIGADGYCITGAPKNKAYAYQRLAGGSGSLDLMTEKK
ncbi:MAG: hypothetical protein ACI4ST_02105 [Candidatus Gallimonas sp.]